MTILEMHYDFKLKSDQVDSLIKKNFLPAEIDWLLNESQNRVITKRIGIGNAKLIGFENTQKRIDDLKNLHIRANLQPAIVPALISTGLYEVILDELVFDYRHLTRVTAEIEDSTGCISTAILKEGTQTDDLSDTLRDPFNKPHKSELPVTFGKASTGVKGSLLINSGNYTVNSVQIDYLKNPTAMSLGGYNGIDGILTVSNDCELSTHLHPEIVNTAVSLAARIMNDPATNLYQDYENTQE